MYALRLPVYVTSFIGRVSEAQAVADLLADRDCRLVTLLGPGGIGKTRLAVHVAGQSAERYPDGVFFVPLQAATSRDDVISATASALNLQLSGSGAPIEQIIHSLEDKRALLVFDNFEHLLDAADLVAELQAAAPAVDCLVTSRERLNLLHEWVFDVPGLRVPDQTHDAAADHFSAVQLFAQTARRARADFSLEAEYAGVVRICRLVEGMPLGIELAASWVRSLTCDEIADELQQGLDILESTSRSLPQAHRDMRAVIAYSWKMLPEDQRAVFARLSVFCGGFSAEAAETIARASRHDLAALLDKSWLRRSPDTGRYFVHELLRQYGEERLRALGDGWHEAHQAHSRYFMHFLAQRWGRLIGADYKEAHLEIEAELENARTAWSWAVTQQDHAAIDAALASWWFFYDSGSRFQEGEQIFAAAVGAVRNRQPVDCTLLGKLLARHGGLCFSLDRFAHASELLEESVTILRAADAPSDLAFALLELGMTVQFFTHDIERARSLFTESETIYRQIGDRWGAAYALHWISQMHLVAYCEQGDPADLSESQRLTQLSADQFRALNNQWGMATTIFMAAEIRRLFGDPQGCWDLATQGLEMYEALGIPWGVSNARGALADAALNMGWTGEVCRLTVEGLKLNLKYHLWNHALYKLHTAAELWLMLNEDELAFTALGAAERERVRLGRARDRWGLYLLDRLDEPLTDRLVQAIERGQSVTFKEAIKQLIVALERTAELNPHQTAPAVGGLIDSLTERELEILQLLAEGKSNRAIAQQLVLALGTVKTHVHNLSGKLHADSRLQAVARARELSLID